MTSEGFKRHGSNSYVAEFAENERELHFYPRHYKAVKGNIGAFLEEHVIEQGAKIRLGDIRRHLHGPGRQTDLVPDQFAPVLDFLFDPGALDGVRVFDRDSRVIEGKLPDLFPRAFGPIQLCGGLQDLLLIEHVEDLLLWVDDGRVGTQHQEAA